MSATGQAAFAFGAGVATFFSPCVVALLPGYVSYYVATVESETAPLSGAFARGLAASVGALGTFAVLSAVALAAGTALERVLPVVERLVGLFLIGLGVLVVSKGALSFRVTLPERRASILGFGVFGSGYALAATACVLPLFLAVSAASLDLAAGGTALVLTAYGVGFAVLMLAATVAVAIGQEALLDRFTGHAGTLTRAAGVVLVLAGLAQLSFALWVAPVNPL